MRGPRESKEIGPSLLPLDPRTPSEMPLYVVASNFGNALPAPLSTLLTITTSSRLNHHVEPANRFDVLRLGVE